MNSEFEKNLEGSVRVATYARVSTQEQASEGTSLAFQQAQLTAYCQLQGWTIINSYVDPGFSGKDGDRPGLERLLNDAKLGLIDKVVVFKLDRLARNLGLLLDTEKALKGYGITLISMKESVDTSSGTGKMVFQMFGMVSEWERSAIVERTRNGRLQRYRDGCWAGGKAPYGYSYDKATRKLVINESEARIVKRMYSEYADGKSLFGISQSLNRDHIPGRTKNSQGWWQTAVRQVLLNPVYKGTEVVNRHAHISLINKMDLSKAIMISVPALVSEQVWQIAQDRMRNNKHVKPNKQGAALLQGMITCGVCGYGYAAKRRYYTCRGRMKYVHPDGLARCKSPYLRADWLENEVWKRIEEIINDPNKLFLVIRESIENLRLTEADLSERIKPIDGRLAEIAEQKARLAEDWIMRHMNGERFKELKDSLDREEARMRDLRAGIDPAQIAELENTRKMLNFWEDQIRAMAWNTENEDGTMVRLADGPHHIALKLVGFEDADLSKSTGFPTSRRQLLDKLQVRLSVFDDRVEVKSLFPVEPVGVQLCTSTKGD
jgi:site-specific DNA recombinase